MTETLATVPLPEGCVRSCHACRHRQQTMEQSLAQKFNHLQEALVPWVDRLQPVRSVSSEQRLRYNDKVKLSARCYDGRWEFGMEPRDEFIPIPRCPVHTERINRTLEVLGRHLPRFEQMPLRFVVQHGSLVTLVVKARELNSIHWVTPEFTGELAAVGVEGLHVNLHPAAGRILFADKGWRCVWGLDRVQDSRGLWHGPGTYGHLLPSLQEESLDAAESFFQLHAHSTIVDLFSGIGASLWRWASRSAHVLGVEFDGEAISCAQRNAPTATLLRGPCVQRLPQARAWLDERELDAVYLRPPRTGLEEAVLDWLAQETKPDRIAHQSRSATSLRRDLEQLTAKGYVVESLLTFDIAPQTHHVEVLALLSRQ